TLKVGTVADAVIFELEEGHFTFIDSFGEGENGCKRLIPKVVIRDGEAYLGGTWNQANWIYPEPTWFKNVTNSQ
ncbi:MAG: hypothetical protein ACFE96_18430, partial [Candidatus Hermodarchaeota archaeon]